MSTQSAVTPYGRAVTALAQAQKPSAGAPLYSRWVNRPLGRRLAALAFVTGRTPNQVTVISALCTFTALGLVLLFPPHWGLGIAIGGLLIAGYALDAADGQLARLRGGGSAAGEWLDHTVDAVKMSVIHLAVFVSVFRFDPTAPAWTLSVPLVFQAASTVFFMSFLLIDQLRRARGGDGRATGAVSKAQSLAAVPTDYGVLCLAFLFFGIPAVFFPMYALLCGGFVVILIGALVRWWHEVSAWGPK